MTLINIFEERVGVFMIGYAFCASFCTFKSSFSALRKLCEGGEEVVPIFSERSLSCDTRFGKASDFLKLAEEITGRRAVTKIEEAELFGAISPLEYLVISPCTGNTLAKLAAGITDGVVTMSAKAHMRCDRPMLIALSSNDAASQNLKNIGALITRRNVFFAPMLQDSPEKKPHSLITEEASLLDAFYAMKRGVQKRPVFLC